MRLLRGVAGRVLACGCLVGVYETYSGTVVSTIDALGPSCDHPHHRLHEALSAEDEVEVAAGAPRPLSPSGR